MPRTWSSQVSSSKWTRCTDMTSDAKEPTSSPDLPENQPTEETVFPEIDAGEAELDHESDEETFTEPQEGPIQKELTRRGLRALDEKRQVPAASTVADPDPTDTSKFETAQEESTPEPKSEIDPGPDPVPLDPPSSDQEIQLPPSSAASARASAGRGLLTKPWLLVLACLVVLIGIAGIVKNLQNGSPLPAGSVLVQSTNLKLPLSPFTQVKEWVKSGQWSQALPLVQNLVEEQPNNRLFTEYLRTIKREVLVTALMQEAAVEVQRHNFKSALAQLRKAPSESLQIEKIKKLVTEIEQQHVRVNLKRAQKAFQAQEYENAELLADDVLLSAPRNQVAIELRDQARAKSKEKLASTESQKKDLSPSVLLSEKKSSVKLEGKSLVAFRQAQVDRALAQATSSRLSKAAHAGLKSFKKLYAQGMNLASHAGRLERAEKLLLQSLTLAEELGGGQGKYLELLRAKLAKAYFVMGETVWRKKKYPKAFRYFSQVLQYQPGFKQAQAHLRDLEREALTLYNTAFVIKASQPEQAMAHCRTVTAMVSESSYSYRRCRVLMAEIEPSGD